MQIRSRLLPLACLVPLALSAPAFAADHLDSPLVRGDAAADINDLYAFVNPNDADELIVIATVTPIANRNSRFSDAVEYRFHFDSGSADGSQLITCTFTDDSTRFSCDGAGVSAAGGIENLVQGDGLRVFAGLRDDPFFFDLAAFNQTRDTLTPAFADPGTDFFAGLDTLSIVLGVQSAALTNAGSEPVLKIHASTRRVGDVGISAGITGSFYDADNPGHGLLLEVLGPAEAGGPDRLLAYWSSFDATGAPVNMIGVGPIDGNRADVAAELVRGGINPGDGASTEVQIEPFGTLAFEFSDCNDGVLSVQPVAEGFNPVEIDITRLTAIKDLPCSFYSAGQIDRMGRPAINTALIDLLTSTGKKDAYNQSEDPAEWAELFQAEIAGTLAALDTLDGTTGNALLPADTLASVLVDDRLIVDTSVASCGAYLAVELGVADQCGGRTLSRDVMDDTLGAVVGPGVSDFVDGNDREFLAAFPFLATPR